MRILLAYDGSPAAETALDLAVSRYGGDELVALYVAEVDPTTYDASAFGGGTDDVPDSDEAEAVLEEARERAVREGYELETDVIQGTPSDVIAEYAGEHGFDQIVMGTHGRQSISEMIVGSTAEQVVRNSPVPVLTVR
ncbi:universal stress protein [Saliphagus sp. LR7]|uniref:universal stress protein n=1 Tax=Saliphagus sp. LR7 TaxID=2282654 RepID=UPI000DF75396|nr:universal stress protein [Saliphagus sp. LR7]